MADLIYGGMASLDGFIADTEGRFDWAVPDEEVLAFINETEASIGTYLYGRRMYETMAAWETMPTETGRSAGDHEFAAVWRSADKIVYSTTLETVSTARTRLERTFDPAAVRRLKETSERDLSVSGPDLAASAVGAGLVDEWQVYLCPVLVGSGKRLFPDGACASLTLVEQRRFGNGTVFLRYRTAEP